MVTSEKLQQGVNVIGYFEGKFGLGETARQLVSSLEKASIPFCLISADFLESNGKKEKYDHSYEESGKYDINIFCIDLIRLFAFLRANEYANPPGSLLKPHVRPQDGDAHFAT